MSMLLMVKAFNVTVGSSLRKLILIKLADNANDKGECFPAYKTIAGQCECGKSTVRNHINELIKMGLVSKKPRFKEHGQSSNLYILHLDKTDKSGCQQRAGGVPAASTRGASSEHHNQSINQSINKDICASEKSDVELLAEYGIVDNVVNEKGRVEKLATEFIELRKRKKAPITATALDYLEREAKKARISTYEAARIAVGNDWRSFQARYVGKQQAQQQQEPEYNPFIGTAEEILYGDDTL